LTVRQADKSLVPCLQSVQPRRTWFENIPHLVTERLWTNIRDGWTRSLNYFLQANGNPLLRSLTC